MTVEYFVAGNGIIDDSGSSRMADRIAKDEAARGYPEAEKFAETWPLFPVGAASSSFRWCRWRWDSP